MSISIDPPKPKYWLGEYILFNREKRGGFDPVAGVGEITSIDVLINREPEKWLIRYFCETVDDDILEEEIVGPMTVGEKR